LAHIIDHPVPEPGQLVEVRRLKSELPKRWDSSSHFPKRKIRAIEMAYTPQEREVHQLLRQYSQLRIEQASDIVQLRKLHRAMDEAVARVSTAGMICDWSMTFTRRSRGRATRSARWHGARYWTGCCCSTTSGTRRRCRRG
jgi:hypothetical protein